MSATTRTIPADAGFGQLAIVFAALLVGVALMAALAYGPLTASQGSVAPAAAPAPAVAHDHGWSSSSLSTTPATHDHGWSTTTRGPAVRDRKAFDKSHHAVKRRFDLVEERGFGSNRVQFAR